MRRMFLVLACGCSLIAFAQGQAHTITSGKLTVTCTPEGGVTEVMLDGTRRWQGATTAVAGTYTTGVQAAAAPAATAQQDTLAWKVAGLSSADKAQARTVTVVAATADRYCVRHAYAQGMTLTFDHAIAGPDITCRVTIDNDTPYDFQLTEWMGYARLTFDEIPTTFGWTRYPGAGAYSGALAVSGKTMGLGINWIEHRLRPVTFRLTATTSKHPTKDQNFVIQLAHSPVQSGGRTRYTVAFRLDTAPGDWKHLLAPYKAWFNRYFGDKARYHVDFRVSLMNTPSNAALITPDNPWGTRGQIDTKGWETFTKERMGGLAAYKGQISRIVFWSILADPRGMNYRAEMDVVPPVVFDTMPVLRQWCRDHEMGFGWFARPNNIPYKMSWTQDGGADWNPFDPSHLTMADRRYQRLLQEGCSAFYLDTYGSHVGEYPGSAEGSVAYLRHLRELLGPDALVFVEWGFDAQHLYAAIWPRGGDDHGKAPLGDFARWLCAGTVEVCRVSTLDGAKRAWEGGAIPFAPPLSAELFALQKQYVRDDWTSVKRPDCPAAHSPVPGPEAQYVPPEK